MKTKKIKDLLIGSNNAGKVREIKQLLPRYIRVSSIIDYKIKVQKKLAKHFYRIPSLNQNFFQKDCKICFATDDLVLEIDIFK